MLGRHVWIFPTDLRALVLITLLQSQIIIRGLFSRSEMSQNKNSDSCICCSVEPILQFLCYWMQPPVLKNFPSKMLQENLFCNYIVVKNENVCRQQSSCLVPICASQIFSRHVVRSCSFFSCIAYWMTEEFAYSRYLGFLL